MGAVPLCVLLHICTAVFPPDGGSVGGLLDLVGVNYGRVADNLPPPAETVTLLQRMGVGTVKLFDTNAEVLQAMGNSSIKVTVMVRNEDIVAVSASEAAADAWIGSNVAPFYPAAHITAIVVGNEIFSYPALAEAWRQLVPAMRYLRASLKRRGLDGAMKVTTSVAGDVLGTSYPPSAGRFRDDIAEPVLRPMLGFLRDSGAPFFINLYPYFAWLGNQANISLEYATFGPGATPVRDGRHRYTNLLDAMVDATFAAMERMGYGSVQLAVSETGWPSDGGDGASVVNAATYNKRLVAKVLRQPGTPRRPSARIPVFIFALFNEDLKPGAATERHWGLLYPDGKPVYQLDLTGTRQQDASDDTSAPISDDTSAPISVAVATPQQRSWCVARAGADTSALQAQLDATCGSGAADTCGAVQAGGTCYLPNTLAAHASYAFHRRWRQQSPSGECEFGGMAELTSVDPSHGSCVFD